MLKKIACILLICLLLCGCSTKDIKDLIPEKTYSQGDVSISLPSTFKNYSNQDMAEGKDFLFADSDTGIVGTKESKNELYDMFGEMDAKGYAELLAELYELDTSVSKKHGHWSFTYEQEVDSVKYTYVAAIHETTAYYWNIQAYCKTSDFEENEDTLWDYLTEIEIADNIPEEDPTEPDSTDPEPTDAEPTDPEPTDLEPTDLEPTDLEPTETMPYLTADISVNLELPDGFLNYSNTELSEGYAFMYANDDICLVGLQESKEELFLYFDEMDVAGYADLIAEIYSTGSTAEEKDGKWTLSYTDDSTGEDFTYICVFYDTGEYFWNLQAFCPTEQYETYEADIWQYLTNVTFVEAE